MRMYFLQELEALLHYNGLAIKHKYGSYEQTAFGAGSNKQLVVCRLAGRGPG